MGNRVPMQDYRAAVNFNGYTVELELSEVNTYEVVRKVGYAQTTLTHGQTIDEAILSLTMIMDNERVAYPTATYKIIQE